MVESAKSPGQFSLTLYKNLDETNNISIVLGIIIDLSPNAINNMFSFSTVDDSGTTQFFNISDLELVEKWLCPYGAGWSFTSIGNNLISFETT